jgi:hypothetical protein
MREARVAIGIAGDRVDETTTVSHTPVCYLTGDVFTAVVVVELGIGTTHGLVKTCPPRMNEP